jgi:hypothetical protein
MNAIARSMFLIAIFAMTASPSAFGQKPNPPDSSLQTPGSRDVPDIALREIQRRGDWVQRVGIGHQSDSLIAFAEAMRPPADDSHKWFISVLTARNCRHCESLKRDFATSDHLKPFVDVDDHAQSWAHFNVYASEDATQAWRFKDIKVAGYPTIIVQPPRNGRFGDAKTVVLQKTGYDGDAKKLAEAIRSGVSLYLRAYVRQRHAIGNSGGMRDGGENRVGQNAIGYDPPFSPPPKNDPMPYYPPAPNFPFDLPPGPTPAPQPTVNPLGLLMNLLGGMASSGGMTNLLLLVLAGLAGVRTFRKATGQKLLLDDATYQVIVDNLKNLIAPTALKTPAQ